MNTSYNNDVAKYLAFQDDSEPGTVRQMGPVHNWSSIVVPAVPAVPGSEPNDIKQ